MAKTLQIGKIACKTRIKLFKYACAKFKSIPKEIRFTVITLTRKRACILNM